MALTAKEVQTLYAGYLGRPADFEGLKYWLGNTTQVTNIEELAQSFYDSAEGKKLYPDNDVTNNINAIYMNLFNRTPDTAGYDYWFNEIVSGKINLAKAVVAIYYGAIGNDKVIAENKVNAAVAFTDQVAASDTASLYYGDKAFASAQSFLATVGETPATAQQIAAAVAASENQSSANGETFTLTTVEDFASTGNSYHGDIADTFKFTGNNEIIEASNATLKTGSVTLLDGSDSDNDVLNVAMSESLALNNTSASGNTPARTITLENIETISLNNSKVGAKFDFPGTNAATVSGLKNIVATGKDIVIDASGYDKNGLNIFGGAGDDVLIGTKNADVLTGGAGADTFNVVNSQKLTMDTITDFSGKDGGQKDKIGFNMSVGNVAKYNGDKTTLDDILDDLDTATTPGFVPGKQAVQSFTFSSTYTLADTKKLTIDGVEVFTADSASSASAEATLTAIKDVIDGKYIGGRNEVSANITENSKWFVEYGENNVVTLTAVKNGTANNTTVVVTDDATPTAVTQTVTLVTLGENDNPQGSVSQYFTNNGDVVYFEVGNTTYVVQADNAVAGYQVATDELVALSGTNFDLDATDFVRII